MKIYLKFVTTLKIKIPVSQILSLVGLSNFSSTNVCEVCVMCVGVVLQMCVKCAWCVWGWCYSIQVGVRGQLWSQS